MNHSEQAESCYRRIHVVQHSFRLECIQDCPETIKVGAFTARNLSVLNGCERRDFVNEECDGSMSSGH